MTSCEPPLYIDACCNLIKPLASSLKDFTCFDESSNNKPVFYDYPSGAAPLSFHYPSRRVGYEEDEKRKFKC